VEVDLSSLSDEELMERVQDGDSAAYSELFERHHPRVYGFLLRRTRDPQRAADQFQETFLSVYRARHTWKRDRPFRPWLFTIAANLSRDAARRAARAPEEPIQEGHLQPAHPRPDARLHLEEAIAGMPDTLRDAFLLGLVEGFDHREIAEQLDITPDNARARVSRARAWLRRQLQA
jgi:RNA polymerase sigma factor (sigma-70 family)